MKGFAVACAMLLAAGAVHAESALTSRSTDLYAQAQLDATKLSTLAENTKVDVVRRSGAWSEVKASGQSGWVRMMNLKLESGSQGTAASSGGGSLVGLLSSGRTSNNATVTTGVKGLTAEDVQNAQPNPAELQKMQKNMVSKDAGQAFAQRTKLSAVKVEYLAAPASTSAPTRNDPTSIPGG